MPTPPRAVLLRGVVTLLALALLLHALTRAWPTGEALLAFGDERLSDGHLSALALFTLAGALSTAIGLPRQSVALVGGYVFGAVTGILATLVAVTLGAGLTCQAARVVGRPRLERHCPSLVATLDGWGRERVFARTLAARLFPIGSNLLINIAAGVAHVDRRAFLAASLIGFVPQTLVFGIAGRGVGASSATAIALAVVLLALSIVVGLGFGRPTAR